MSRAKKTGLALARKIVRSQADKLTDLRRANGLPPLSSGSLEHLATVVATGAEDLTTMSKMLEIMFSEDLSGNERNDAVDPGH